MKKWIIVNDYSNNNIKRYNYLQKQNDNSAYGWTDCRDDAYKVSRRKDALLIKDILEQFFKELERNSNIKIWREMK